MVKWEYRIEPAIRALGKWDEKSLNALGDQDWEAVGIVYDGKASQTYILFKRPRS